MLLHNSSIRQKPKFSEIIENEKDHSKISEKFNDYISNDSSYTDAILGNQSSFKEEL